MKFDGGIWSILGEARDVLISEERRTILTLLAREGPLYPKDIGSFLGKSCEATRYLLFAMKKDGQVVNTERGEYALPS